MAKDKGDDQLKDEAVDAAAAPKSKKKIIVLILAVVVLVVVLAGAAAVWLMMSHSEEGDKQEQHAAQEESGPPIYERLDTFTVNLADGERYLQVELALKLADSEVQGKLKAYMPDVRDSLLRLLSSKNAEELVGQEGKAKLAEEIAAQINSVLHIAEEGKGVKGVLFNSFIIQ